MIIDIYKGMIINDNVKELRWMEIKKILKRTDGIKYLIVPKASNLNAGDFVMINKIEEKEVEKCQKIKKK